MAIYTGVADANGDFNIPFSANYTGGQKVTVTAEKDAATKTIELFAPSSVTGGGSITFSGNLVNFPANIGIISLESSISGQISNYAMQSANNADSIFKKSTGLNIKGAVTSIGQYAFYGWINATSLVLPSTLTTIMNDAFSGWGNLLSLTIPDSVTSIGEFAFSNCKKVTSLTLPNAITSISGSAFYSFEALPSLILPASISSIGEYNFYGLKSCNEIVCLRATPPTLATQVFGQLKAGCVFKVPSGSLAAYKSAPGWSAFSAQMVGV